MSSCFSNDQNGAGASVPVCTDAGELSGGLEGAQRACVLSRLWVLPISITLMQLKACATRTPNYLINTHSERTASRRPS